MRMRSRVFWVAGFFLAASAANLGCSSGDDSNGEPTPGVGGGGAATGGSATGGDATGGDATGGNATGGNAGTTNTGGLGAGGAPDPTGGAGGTGGTPLPAGLTVLETKAPEVGGVTAGLAPVVGPAIVASSARPNIITLGAAKQQVVGFGVSLTPSVAALLNAIDPADRTMILDEYFNPAKGGMNLVRLTIGTSDFALNDYSYQDSPDAAFSIQPDVDNGLLQLVLDAQAAAGGPGSIKFISSTWTAPPWMKSNNSYIGGTINSANYQDFADYVTNYVQAYADQGIPIWGVTPQNEPEHMGQFPTMGFPGGQTGHTEYIGQHLGPTLKAAFPDIKIIGFDHNKGSSLVSWATSVNNDAAARGYTDGMANHWYGNTWDPGEQSLEDVHALNPDWLQIATEQGLSAINTTEIAEAAWMNDTWFWTRTSNDWGTASNPTGHPIVVGMFRYAEDIIATFNHWQQGWIQWNAVTDKYGGPSHGENPESAVKAQSPFMVDVCGQQPCAGDAWGIRGSLDVFKSPTLYVLEHFAKFFLPEGTVLETTISPAPPDYAVNPDQSPAAIRPSVCAVGTRNPDGSIAVNILNMNEAPVEYQIVLPDGQIVETTISAKALQTVLVN